MDECIVLPTAKSYQSTLQRVDLDNKVSTAGLQGEGLNDGRAEKCASSEIQKDHNPELDTAIPANKLAAWQIDRTRQKNLLKALEVQCQKPFTDIITEFLQFFCAFVLYFWLPKP
jgi:hypothetical protein